MARTLARDYGARLLVLYVEPPPVVLAGELAALAPDPAEIQRIKDRLFSPMHPLVPDGVVEHYSRGDPATSIVRLARERGVDSS